MKPSLRGSLKPKQIKTLRQNNYYPFGLKHKGYNEITNTNRSEAAEKYKFQEQERNEELGLNWDSFKWRNYDYAIGRFMNIDPLSEKYAYQSHYNFAENRVIDGRELEGLEWIRSTDGNNVHYDVKVQIVNSANLNNEQITEIADKIKNEFDATYSQIEGYTATMSYEIVNEATADYTIDIVKQINESKENKDGGIMHTNGQTDKFANTKKNTIKLSAYNSKGRERSASAISGTALHELGHSAGLTHPWESKIEPVSDINQNSGKVDNKTIKQNIMNSDANPKPSLRSTNGRSLTDQQIKEIDKVVTRFQ